VTAMLLMTVNLEKTERNSAEKCSITGEGNRTQFYTHM
jgi:hypothetical protein